MDDSFNPKRLSINATFFVIGAIATIILTKFSDKILPADPTVIKQLTDTIKIVHEYRLPERSEITESKESIKNKTEQAKQLKEDIKYLNDIKEEQKLVDSTIRSLQNEINEQNALIFKENYNSTLDGDVLLKSMRGYSSSGQSSNFEFVCPEDKTSDYLNIKMSFYDPRLVEKIGCIMIIVYEKRKIENDEKFYQIYEQTYQVKEGLNIVRLKNYLKRGRGQLSVGYILKSEMNKEFPNFEKIDCNYLNY